MNINEAYYAYQNCLLDASENTNINTRGTFISKQAGEID